MERLQAYKFELRVKEADKAVLSRFSGACRFVFNKALALQKERYAQGEKYISYVRMASFLVEWKQSSEFSWLKHAPSQALQQSLKDLDRAYRNFFSKRSGFPRFKKRGIKDSFRYPDGIKLDQGNSRIFLPKLGWVRYRNSRKVLGEVRNVTVSQTCGKWYISVQSRQEVEAPVPSSTSMVGVDMGVAKFATLSNGEVFLPVSSFKHRQRRLAFVQRRMSRKVKFSQNWRKAKRKVQKIHTKTGNIRRDYTHKTSTAISKNHVMVVVEDLQVRNMSKSAKGSKASPGRNVRAKSGLNRSILDQGWYEFRRQLAYKLPWNGGEVLAISPKNTSRMCSCCGHTDQENRPAQDKFLCCVCGFRENADINAAKNILAAGHAVLACGEKGSGLRHKAQVKPVLKKQEPTSIVQAIAA